MHCCISIGNELQISSASVGSEFGAKGLGVVEDNVEMLQASVIGPSGTLYSNCQVTTLTDGQLGNLQWINFITNSKSSLDINIITSVGA